MSQAGIVVVEEEEILIIEVGEQGPPGTSSGALGTATETGDIPLLQVYTLANPPSEPITLTLPPIADVLVDGLTQAYMVKNIGDFDVTLVGSDGDQIEFESDALIRGNENFHASLTLLATSLGWLVI